MNSQLQEHKTTTYKYCVIVYILENILAVLFYTQSRFTYLSQSSCGSHAVLPLSPS